MRASGETGFRRLIGVSAAMAVLLLGAVSITAAKLSQRQELIARHGSASELATQATDLRVEANNLFSWQMVAALAMLGPEQRMIDPTGEAHHHFRDSLTTIVTALAAMEPTAEGSAERSLLEQARTGFEELGRLDERATADYRSGDPARRAQAMQVTASEIVQFQHASQALGQLAEAYRQRADRVAQESDEIARRTDLLLVALTTAMITALSGLALWVWRGDRRRTEDLKVLEQEANLDPLTGVANRRRWDRALADAMRDCAANGESLSVVMVDLDHFKRFNDTYGHPAGDRHLQAVARLLVDATRRHDLVARLGGEEFAVLLIGSEADDARRVVDRVQPRIPGGQTMSAGVAEWNGSESGEELIARADLALYRAKAAGRNRLALAG